MKKFTFPLDRVLVWRRLELDREQATLQRLQSECNAIAARETAVRRQRVDSERQISNDRYIDSIFLSTLPQWQNATRLALVSLAAKLVAADQKVVQQQARFYEAKRRVELLERLREKRLDAWKAELSLEEEAFAAEAFLARTVRH